MCVHANIHRKRSIEVGESAVGVPVQVPGTVRGMIPYAHGVVAQHDSLAIDGDLDQIAEPGELLGQLARVLVVVAGYSEYLLAANLAPQFNCPCFWTDAEIPRKYKISFALTRLLRRSPRANSLSYPKGAF